MPEAATVRLNVAEQDRAARALRRTLGISKMAAARAGLSTDRIVEVLRQLLAEEELLLAEQRAAERTY